MHKYIRYNLLYPATLQSMDTYGFHWNKMGSRLVWSNLNVISKMMSSDCGNDVVHLYPICKHEPHAKILTEKESREKKKETQRKLERWIRQKRMSHVINHYLEEIHVKRKRKLRKLKKKYCQKWTNKICLRENTPEVTKVFGKILFVFKLLFFGVALAKCEVMVDRHLPSDF